MRRPLLIGPALGVVVLGGAPGVALGASVGVDARAGHLVYQAAAGERNDVRIRAKAHGSDPNILLTLRIIDSVPIVPGQGCIRPAAGNPNIVRCEYRQGRLSRPIFHLGDRSDSATFSTNTYLGSYLMGGPGNDKLAGGRGNEVFAGGAGDDVMSGAGGSDVFDEDNAANGSDEMHGGRGSDHGLLRGRDRVDYGARRHSVRADLSGDRDDGERGERDLIGADVEVLGGGRGDDRLTGNDGGNQLAGRAGTDALFGAGGSDRLFAGGGATAPAITADSLDGGPGSDELVGSDGPNLMTGGPDADVIYPDKGQDTVRASDGAVDVVQCGRGDDIVRSDPFEFLLGCESHDAYSSASPVPLSIHVADNRASVSFTVGCRENHPASCTGTVQLELAGEAISPEVAFSGPNRHRYGLMTEAGRPLPPGAERSDDLVVRVRSQDSAGAPTNDAFPASMLLSASLLF
jgi:Ca2+-binding RTX toxin-like protein